MRPKCSAASARPSPSIRGWCATWTGAWPATRTRPEHRSRIGYQWSVETSVYVHGDFQRRGVGRALYRSLLAILAAQGHFNAYTGITLPNPASVALHESVGFRPLTVYRHVGFKLGEWQDVGWWHAELQPYAASPPSPTPVPALLARPSWRTLLEAGLEHLKSR